MAILQPNAHDLAKIISVNVSARLDSAGVPATVLRELSRTGPTAQKVFKVLTVS